MASEELLLRMRTQGARTFATEVEAGATAVKSLGTAT